MKATKIDNPQVYEGYMPHVIGEKVRMNRGGPVCIVLDFDGHSKDLVIGDGNDEFLVHGIMIHRVADEDA